MKTQYKTVKNLQEQITLIDIISLNKSLKNNIKINYWELFSWKSSIRYH